jgi:peptide/nickel transport system substrate-binding protein
MLRLLSVLLALLLLAAACGDSDDDGGDGETTETTAAPDETSETTAAPDEGATTTAAPEEGGTTTAAPDEGAAAEGVHGGTLTIGYEAETDRFFPGNGNIGFPARAVHHLVYGSLTAASRDGVWVPYLAESVESNEDATVWTVGLREGMMFHDGTPMDAEAVKASMDLIRLESLSAAAFAYITDVQAVDPLTVEITLSEPYGVFPQVLADEFGAIVSPTAVAAAGDTYGDVPVGAGPYKVVEFVRDDHLTLERNPDFFMPDRGWADTITFRPIPDDAARSAALRAGDLDIITQGNPVEIASFREDDAFRLHEEPNGAQGILFSVTNIPDVRVRQAVAMAVDKEALVDLVWNGIGEAVDTPFPEDSFWYTDVSYPEFDPEGAAALIEEVEAETGQPVTFRILSPIDETNTNYKLAVAEQLRAVGIEPEIQNAADVNDYVNLYLTGDYDITMAGVFALIDPWFEYTRRYQSESVLNGTGFVDPELDAGLATGQASLDDDERKTGYDAVQNILADNMVQMFTRSNTAAVITSDKIEGYGTLVGPEGELTLGNFPLFLRADEFWRNDL